MWMIRRCPALAALPLALLCGCPTPPPPESPRTADADARSGEDATRAGAAQLPLDTPTTDDVNWKEGDRTDWKKVELAAAGAGVLVVELRWDKPDADLDCDVFNSFGQQLVAGPSAAGEPRKKLLVPVDAAGVFYVRVQAVRPGDASVYVVSAHFDAGAKPPPPVPAGNPPLAGTDKPVETNPDAGDSGEPPPEKDAEEVQGRIVTSYVEGGALVLQLDKGAAAGLKVGQKGTVLEGPTGNNPLANGEFTITHVVDGNRSVARSRLRGVGKHRRVVINVE